MSADSRSGGPARPGASAILLDGFVAGLVGAVAVVVVFLVYDAATGDALRTPSVLAALLFEGSEAARTVEPEIRRAVQYNAVHFPAWIAAGCLLSFLVAFVEAHPRIWYLVFVAVAFVFASGLYVVGAFGVPGLGRHQLWVGALVGACALGLVLWRRHPGLVRHLDDVYEP